MINWIRSNGIRHPVASWLPKGLGIPVSGLIGGLPITSVIVRSSVNVGIGAKSKLSAVFHGFLLVFSVLLFPALLNRIPLAALAAILLVTGFRLASPKLFKQMWSQGRYQFAPFIITLGGYCDDGPVDWSDHRSVC